MLSAVEYAHCRVESNSSRIQCNMAGARSKALFVASHEHEGSPKRVFVLRYGIMESLDENAVQCDTLVCAAGGLSEDGAAADLLANVCERSRQRPERGPRAQRRPRAHELVVVQREQRLPHRVARRLVHPLVLLAEPVHERVCVRAGECPFRGQCAILVNERRMRFTDAAVGERT